MVKGKSNSRNEMLNPNFPVRINLGFLYINTIILLLLILGVSITGIVFQSEVYGSKEMKDIFLPNDILNLAFGVPLLITVLYFTIRRNLAGLLCYPGALFYVTYVYTAYLLGLPFNILYIPYLLLVVLSFYSIIALVASYDHEKIRQKLSGHVPIRISGIILAVLAMLVIIFQISSIISSLVHHAEVNLLMTAQWIDDLIIAAPPALIASIYMIKRQPLGYTVGVSLLLVLTLLFVGLIPVMLVTARLTGNPVKILDIFIIVLSSMICIIPFILFLRGISRAMKTDL